MSTITSSIEHATGTSSGVIVFIVLVVVAALVLLAAVLILLRPTRRKGNSRPPVRQSRPLRPPAIDADRAHEHRDIARRAAALKWQQDQAALQAARAIQRAVDRPGCGGGSESMEG